MGLTRSSTGMTDLGSCFTVKKNHESDKTIALAGNPNVGKSTVFNGLTGLKQHTGNWSGKTVTNAQGYCQTADHSYVMVDIPGTYSLMAHSTEEEVARNFICFGEPDAVVVVCDATCLERNLNLVLQTIEITNRVIVCVNLLDEAKRKHIHIDLEKLSSSLGVPVVGVVARQKRTLKKLTAKLDRLSDHKDEASPPIIYYSDEVENAIDLVQRQLKYHDIKGLNPRWLSLQLLADDPRLIKEIENHIGNNFFEEENIDEALVEAKEILHNAELTKDLFNDNIVSTLVTKAEEICHEVVSFESETYDKVDRKLDHILTSKITGYPVMIGLLAVIFWITITGANYPSGVIADFLWWLQDRLTDLFHYFGAPDWLHGSLVLGIYRVLAWVVSVMLPPMAIFFPLFTLLEDSGYLPRIAYNLDKPFKRCQACGKQALTMCMGFGCNAAGIVGCRIIDSPRERLLAILTNNFVPCNGRFPTLIAILSMFFIASAGSVSSSFLSALLLTLVIVTGVFMTFAVTKLLSKTILKGVPSSFTLELPPYRKPQIGKVIVRSIFDRTLFVLARAVAVAAPAGLVIWILANINVGDTSILNQCARFLDPFARLMGLDGVILIAFILGFPANEIVVPIIIMAYMAKGSILELDSLDQMKQLFVDNGWTVSTAISTMLFSLMHWPCSTTLLTIKKETGSWKWTGLAALIPTVIGIATCMIFTLVMRIFQ